MIAGWPTPVGLFTVGPAFLLRRIAPHASSRPPPAPDGNYRKETTSKNPSTPPQPSPTGVSISAPPPPSPPSVRREGGNVLGMKLTIELDREVDGRWIAEVPELNVLLYGDSARSVGSQGNTVGPHSARGTAPGFRERYVRNRGVSSWPATKAQRFANGTVVRRVPVR